MLLLLALATARADAPVEPPAETPADPSVAPVTPPAAPAAPPPKIVHWTEVEVKTRPRVTSSDYPEAANSLPTEKLGCTVRVSVDVDGIPTGAEARSCDPALLPSAQAIAMRYRFFPTRGKDGVAIPVTFDLRINFSGSSGPPTDMRIASATDSLKLDRAAGFTPVGPDALHVRHEAPARLRDMPRTAAGHAVPDRTCRLHLHILGNGRVVQTFPQRCASDLLAPAGALIEGWRFVPIRRDGHRTDVSIDALVIYDGAAPRVLFLAATADPADAVVGHAR